MSKTHLTRDALTPLCGAPYNPKDSPPLQPIDSKPRDWPEGVTDKEGDPAPSDCEECLGAWGWF